MHSQSAFLDKLNIPTFHEKFKKNLETELKEEEISIAIDSMKSGQIAGPDGLPIDIYKKFKQKLLKPFRSISVWESSKINVRSLNYSVAKTRKA